MSLKIKISILAICFALLAAVCIGFAFAAPNEKLNLKGTLSYEVAKAAISVSPNISALGSTTGSGDYTIGETVTLTATPSSGSNSTFIAWATSTDPKEMEIVSTSPTYSFEISLNSPTTYFALFNSTTSTGRTVGNLVYTFYNQAKLAEVTDTTSTTVPYGKIAIPSVVSSSYKVYSIGFGAFQYCSNLNSITIPEGVTSIGDRAFYSCGQLITITIPEGVTSIGDSAFYLCGNLNSITIPESVTSIGEEAFCVCSSLTTITIPKGVTSIGSNAFRGCRSLEVFNEEGNEYYTIDDNRALIVDGGKTLLAYAVANTATSYEIPESVTSIYDSAFYLCSKLTTITIPEGVTSIYDSAFYSCSSLTEITVPEGVTSIGEEAFAGCSSLTEIKIPEGVTSIGSGAFQACRSLTSVSLPSTLTSINKRAFYGCSQLTTITIPEGVTSIGEEAFRSCSSLTTATLPSTLTSIGLYAFYYCSSLTTITINGNITSLRTSIFYDCNKLTSLTLGAGVTSLPSNLFTGDNLTKLTEIEVLGDLTSTTFPSGTWYKDGVAVRSFDGAGIYTKQP